jgi:hypothetical protein
VPEASMLTTRPPKPSALGLLGQLRHGKNKTRSSVSLTQASNFWSLNTERSYIVGNYQADGLGMAQKLSNVTCFVKMKALL